MSEFGDKIDGLARIRRNIEAMVKAGTELGLSKVGAEQASPTLLPVEVFGTNPGQLRMLKFVPHGLPRNAPLVVNLHGCLQTAGPYQVAAGWSDLAERLGFALLCPEQLRSNNAHNCFNWFQPGDITRGEGEVESIRQMIDCMLRDHSLDRRRVFITGLSAGGAMTAAMLATYPELFAGGAIIAGLPYHSAGNVQEALDTMMHCRPRPEQEWAALVRSANPQAREWPRLSIWHGASDTTVVPANAIEAVKQWRAVQGLPKEPARQDVVDGARHSIWRNAQGVDMLEEYVVPGLGHGTPIDPTAADPARRCGVPAPYVLDATIPSTLHIARFWGLLPQSVPAARGDQPPRPAPAKGARMEDFRAAKVRPSVLLGAAGRALDPKQTIERALRAAGLMKRRRP